MQISFSNNNFLSQKYPVQNQYSYPRSTFGCCIKPALKFDTVSFGSLKKSQLNELDFFVVEKFKPPIEKFRTHENLQEWASEETDKILQKDFSARQESTTAERENILNEWKEEILDSNQKYTNTESLLIFDAITKDLKHNNDNLPPKFNENILTDCLLEVRNSLTEDRKYKFDFNKIYKTKLQTMLLTAENGNKNSFWLIIPSKQNDPENYTANTEKLKTLSSKYWCTRGTTGGHYLAEGDFHIYFEKGHPRIGLKFVGNKIDEIQAEDNSGIIPIEYTDILDNHIKEGNYKLSQDTRTRYENTIRAKKKFEKLKKALAPAIEKNNSKAIFNQLGIKAVKDSDGMLILDEYRQPDENFTFTDLGIDENNLFAQVKEIKGGANFKGSSITNLQNLKSIGGSCSFSESKVEDLGCLESIGRDANFSNSQVISLGNLKTIGGNAKFMDTKLSSLGKLQRIGGDLTILNSKIQSLGDLEYIGESATLIYTNITDLGKLKHANLIFIAGNTKLSEEDFKDIEVNQLIIQK